MSNSADIAARIFDRLTREASIKPAIEKLVNQDLYRLVEYLKALDAQDGAGVPGMFKLLSDAEIKRRWLKHYEKYDANLTDQKLTAEDYPAGATAAEGMDAAMGGKSL